MKGETKQWSVWGGSWIHYAKLGTLWCFCPRESCGLDSSIGERSEKMQALFRRAARAADPIDAPLIVCTSSLFSCLSSPGGETGFFIWIVTARNGFGEVLVSCWLSLPPYSHFSAQQQLSALSYKRLRVTGIPLNICAAKLSYGRPLPGECMCHLQSLQFRMTFLSKDCPRAHMPCLFTHE